MSRLDEIKNNYTFEHLRGKFMLAPETMEYLIDQAERYDEARLDAMKIHKEKERYKQALESSTSELNYALNSHKSSDVKLHYVKNAKRYMDEALEATHDR